VLAVIHWIGGLSFVTLIALPFAKSRPTADEALTLFEGVERRFSAQLRVTIPLVGATGLRMSYRLELWHALLPDHNRASAAAAGSRNESHAEGTLEAAGPFRYAEPTTVMSRQEQPRRKDRFDRSLHPSRCREA
jgi:hypothetical protein